MRNASVQAPESRIPVQEPVPVPSVTKRVGGAAAAVLALAASGCYNTRELEHKKFDNTGKELGTETYHVVEDIEETLATYTKERKFDIKAEVPVDGTGTPQATVGGSSKFADLGYDDLTEHTITLCKTAWLAYNTAPFDEKNRDQFWATLQGITRQSLAGRERVELAALRAKENLRETDKEATAKTGDEGTVAAVEKAIAGLPSDDKGASDGPVALARNAQAAASSAATAPEERAQALKSLATLTKAADPKISAQLSETAKTLEDAISKAKGAQAALDIIKASE